jgi:peptide/nickel transport system permease protein
MTGALKAPQPVYFWSRARQHRSFVLGLSLTALVLMAAALSWVWTPWSPYEIDMAAKLQTPNWQHWLGTDPFGRDVSAMLLVGARHSIAVGLVAVTLGLVTGSALGLWAAARGGWPEELIMRLTDFTFAFPAVLSAIMMTAVFGAGMLNAMGLLAFSTFRCLRASPGARPRPYGRATMCWPPAPVAKARGASRWTTCCPTCSRC